MYIDLLIKIKNAQAAGKKILRTTSYGKMDLAILEKLLQAGFIGKVEVKNRLSKKELEILLTGKRPIQGLKFFSRPSIKTYVSFKKILPFKGEKGLIVLSTPKGIKSGYEAKKEKVGGQLLFGVF